MDTLFAGLMSGTSLDGVDAVLASFDSDQRVRVINSEFLPYPKTFREKLLELINNPHSDQAFIREIDVELGELYAQATLKLTAEHQGSQVQAIGCHGQTILHQPDADPPFTWQAGDPKTLARLTGMTVVSDFRSADMNHGGQGAPLAPAFHQYAFSSGKEAIAVVNIGGIANVTYLPADRSEPVIGFDTGPGNTLSDRWVQMCKGDSYDKNGSWASSATFNESLLESFLLDRYFSEPPPKSLDTRYFNVDWLKRKLDAVTDQGQDTAVIQSTIAAFTADSIWLGIKKWIPNVRRIVLCGGGAHNFAMVGRLEQITGLEVSTSEEFGVSPDDVEACAFAWLAKQRINGFPANLPSVTGASHKVLLGSITNPD
ncbi:MAG: anhydro-N-acetylmuramic acid kinase [Gammaproteobacteria bacterium]|nr:anhydro-N-acetylmuramic acid kinase [Gammaproteobacteria bacterium]